jgi:hypothetical protein
MTDTQTLSAAANAPLANKLIEQALATPEEEQSVPVVSPSDTHVILPTGYLKVLSGEVVTDAEVRELTGRDEEALAREATIGRQLNTILRRGVVSIGGERVTEDILDQLLAGDRDELMLGIYKATFGNPAELYGWCAGCGETKDIHVDLNADIPRKILADPVGDRSFEVKGRKAVYTVHLPNGSAQKKFNENADTLSVAEMSSVLLEHCVTSINGQPVYSPDQVKNISVADRRVLLKELTERNPGPDLTDQTVTCPDCGQQVVVPVTLGAIFRF